MDCSLPGSSVHGIFQARVLEWAGISFKLILNIINRVGFPGGLAVKNPAKQEMQETQVRSLGREDHLKEEMGTHFSILAWRIPWTEESG